MTAASLPTPIEPSQRRGGRWRLVALVSLAINLFAIGIGVGGAVRDRRRGPPPPGGPPFSIRGAGAALPEKVRPLVDEVRKAHEQRVDQAFDVLRAKAEPVEAAIVAEPFDPARLEAALADMRAAHDALQIELHGELVDLAKRLGPADRQVLARASKRPGRGRGPGPPPGPPP